MRAWWPSSPNEWGESADVTFYCDDESHEYQPTPEEIEATEAYLKRREDAEAMREHVTEFAKAAFPKFPAKGQSKLRQWAYEAFEAAYECEPHDAWEGFKQPRGKALDQFILMHAVPSCLPEVPERALKTGYEPWPYDLDDLLGFISFVDDVLMPAGYGLSEGERDLMDHLHGIFAAEDEDEIFGKDDEAADASGIDDAAMPTSLPSRPMPSTTRGSRGARRLAQPRPAPTTGRAVSSLPYTKLRRRFHHEGNPRSHGRPHGRHALPENARSRRARQLPRRPAGMRGRAHRAHGLRVRRRAVRLLQRGGAAARERLRAQPRDIADSAMAEAGYASQEDPSRAVREGELFHIVFGDLVCVGLDAETGEDRDITDAERARVMERFGTFGSIASGPLETCAVLARKGRTVRL